MQRRLFLAATGLAASSLAAPGFAQTPLILDRNRPDRIQPVTPATPDAAQRAPAASSARVEGGAGRADATIRSIRFTGTEAPAPVAQEAQRFVGKPATAANLAALATALSNGYAKADIALYSVLIPDQRFVDGVLQVVLIEGMVEKVELADKSKGRARRLIARIAAHMTGETPLRKSTLQRYVSLVQDVPGTKTDIQILQGSGRGKVRVVLTVTDKPADLGFGFDNRSGTTYKGGEFNATARLYGLARGGDETDLTAAASANFKNYRYASIAHSTPVGTNGGRLTASFGYLKTKPRRSQIEGEAELAGITYSFPILRSYKRNLTASATFDGLNSDNAAFGQLISSERTRAGRVALGYAEALPKRSITAGATVSRGFDILGARVIAPFAETGFTKVNARATIDQAIGKRIVARLRVSGQYSRDRLPAAERFAVGGEEFGRAFEVAVISADRGVAGLAELAIRPVKAKAFANSELYGFVDGARVTILDRGPFPGGDFDLASAGGGARIAWTDKAALFLEAARPIDRPYPGYEKDWRLSVGWKLSLKP
jgi:hemolysin activation/secretion protein